MNIAVTDPLMSPAQGAPPEPLDCLDGSLATFELKVYTKDDGRRVRFISDGVKADPDAKQFDIAFFDSQREADRVAEAVADFLTIAGMPADLQGWHDVPKTTSIETFLPTLLAAARGKVWSEPEGAPLMGAEPGEAEPGGPVLSVGLGEALPKEGRRWARRREARFCYKMGQGRSAKQVAADPEIQSTPAACYRRASELGLSFNETPTGHVSAYLPLSNLLVIDRAAAKKGQTREAFMTSWLKKATADPARYGLIAV